LKTLRIALAILFAALAAACQTVGGPAPDKAALLQQAGFKQESTADFNKDLKPDDIRTTALFVCEDARCGGLALVAFGEEPDGSTTQNDLRDLARQPRAQALRTAARLLRSVGIADLNPIGIVAQRSADGSPAYRLDLQGRIAGERVTMRLTSVYRGRSGRLVVAVSPSAAIVRRFGGLDMLE
jgi:hypothetical protein